MKQEDKMEIKYRIESFNETLGHIVITMYNDVFTYGPYNFELPHPIPDEEGIHRFIQSKIPHDLFDRAQRIADTGAGCDHIKHMLDHEYVMPARPDLKKVPKQKSEVKEVAGPKKTKKEIKPAG